jgi:hypothetical protein
MSLKQGRGMPAAVIGIGVLLLMSFLVVAPSYADPATWNGYVESANYYRDEVGWSKNRLAAQLEGKKVVGNAGIFKKVAFNVQFRVSYDAVYEINDDEFGDEAGGAIMLENLGANIGLGPAFVPHGGGVINHDSFTGLTGIASNAFGFDLSRNPNEGLIVLGEHLHSARGGVTFGVPVRPFDKDSRGSLNGYMDYDKDELASPELFSDECDWLREAYVDASLPIAGKALNFRIGKQQVVWGRTDLFRVLDVINPVDYSRNNIYDELEDIRIPQWIFNAEYRNGATGFLNDFNVQLIWNFDKFRPNNLGQAGTPNQILNAGSFFRGMRNLWDNGGTVSNFGLGGVVATDFGPHQIGLRDVEMPEWELSNTQVGLKVEGVWQDFGWSINGYNYRSQLPSLRAGRVPAINPFLGENFPADAIYPGHPGEDGAAYRDYLIAFDLYFPRVSLLGGSVDYYSQAIDTVFRIEGAYTQGEEFANTLSPRLFSESPVARYVFGADKNIFIRAINNTKAFLFSAQIFGQHILDHEVESTVLTGQTNQAAGGNSVYRKAGMPDWEEDWIATLLIKGWWMNDQLSPQVVYAHDFKAHADAIAPSIEWLISDHWKMNVGFNIKFGRDYDSSTFEWDDARSANMYPPFTTTGSYSDIASTLGLAGWEPLGRFRAGPIGMAQMEDEFQFTFQYRF